MRIEHKIQDDRRNKIKWKKKKKENYENINRNEHLSFLFGFILLDLVSEYWKLVDLLVSSFFFWFALLNENSLLYVFLISLPIATHSGKILVQQETRVCRVPFTTCACVCMFVHRSSYSSLNRIDNRHELNGQNIKQANPNPYSEILKYHFINIFNINATLPMVTIYTIHALHAIHTLHLVFICFVCISAKNGFFRHCIICLQLLFIWQPITMFKTDNTISTEDWKPKEWEKKR